MQHPMPTWAADGVSLLPLIEKLAASPDKNDTSARPAEHPLVFSFGAIINNQWKLVHNPGVGQSISMGVFLFCLEEARVGLLGTHSNVAECGSHFTSISTRPVETASFRPFCN